MLYKSTRNDQIKITGSKAIAKGISEEGGLFVPEEIPVIKADFQELSKMSYIDLAKEILGAYLPDYTVEEISDCAEKAYSVNFPEDEPVKITKLENKYMLELWHGPTCAFKDMALQILPHLLTKALKKNFDGKKAVILVATSGDTGKAALEGFKDVDGTEIIVFYPQNGVSQMQLKQMNTQEGENVSVCSVEGNFDDCQTEVKKIFTNDEMKARLLESNMIFSSANSINWGRLLPQIIYYFYAYFNLYNSGEIKSFDEKVNIVVPTGNFGNILASYYAMRMGLPVKKFICASNANNVLTEFIDTGKYNKSRKFYTTNSPSMDILVSSNLERLLYHISGDNSEKIKEWMKELNTKGEYTLDETTLETLKELFVGGSCDDEETKAEIKSVFEKYDYIMDTHTAVAVKVYRDYVEKTNDQTPSIIASTASPYKFSESVLSAISDEEVQGEFNMVSKLSEITKTEILAPIKELENKKQRFDNNCTKETISSFVLNTLVLNTLVLNTLEIDGSN